VRDRLQSACGGRLGATIAIAICLLGLGLRLDYAIDAPQRPVDDARAYERIAAALYSGQGYTQGEAGAHLQSASNYQPGLPLLVTGIYELRGAADPEAARIVLALLSALAVPFAFLLGRRLAGPGAGLIAALPVAVYPALLEYSGMLMTEPIGSALMAGMVLLFLRAREHPQRTWPWALCGIAIGAAAMLRPEYLLLILVLPALALLPRAGSRSRPDRRQLGRAALMASCAVLVVLPWTARNYVAFDRVVPISTGGGQVLDAGSYMRAGPDPEGVTADVLAEHPWIRRELGPRPGPIYRGQALAALAERRHPGEDTDTALVGMALHAYADHAVHEPLALAGFLAGKVWFGWTEPARGVMRWPLWRALQLALLVAAAAGLAIGLARRRFDVAAIAAVLLLETLVQAVFIASPRRTLTLLPLTAALAGAGAVWLAAGARALAGRGPASAGEPAAPRPVDP
jgi:4-amino-4-deoxy-L-arabinose transferase-like glycosyltransferase